MNFLMHKILQTLKDFAGTFCWAQTIYLSIYEECKNIYVEFIMLLPFAKFLIEYPAMQNCNANIIVQKVKWNVITFIYFLEGLFRNIKIVSIEWFV